MVAAAAFPHAIDPPSARFPITDKNGNPTQIYMSMITQMWQALSGNNLIIPCSVGGSANNIILTPLVSTPPTQTPGAAIPYTVYSTWAFVAAAASTGAVTGGLVGQSTNLPIYRSNGAVQAGVGDIALGLQYFLTYVDTLNSGAGGFVLR